MDPITIFKGTSGLNTVADPARIPIGQDGISDVSEAVNISIDQYSRPSRRKGFSLISSGSFHSLYCDGGDCFVAKGDAIFRVGSDFSLQGIRSGMTESIRVSWKQAGDRTYYSNGSQRGVIRDGVSSVWSVGDYHGPATSKIFTMPANMEHLEVFSGRMFASDRTTLWWSEPFRFDLFCQSEAFVQFNSNIRMVKVVDGGVFVGTEKNTWFLAGKDPGSFQLRKVASFPPLEWSDAIEYVDAGDIGFEPGLCALWASIEGAILGFPSGQIKNLNKSKVIYPENVTRGFGVLYGYQFIHGME